MPIESQVDDDGWECQKCSESIEEQWFLPLTSDITSKFWVIIIIIIIIIIG
jgi:hypothetical protein